MLSNDTFLLRYVIDAVITAVIATHHRQTLTLTLTLILIKQCSKNHI